MLTLQQMVHYDADGRHVGPVALLTYGGLWLTTNETELDELESYWKNLGRCADRSVAEERDLASGELRLTVTTLTVY